jgi:hypothetical protein
MVDRMIVDCCPDPSIGVAAQLKSILPETGGDPAIGASVARFRRRKGQR